MALHEDSKRTQNEFAVDSDQPTSPLDTTARRPLDPDARFTARRGPRFELVKEEIDILKRLHEAVDKRTSPTAPPEERRAAAAEMFEEDAEIAALWDRLQELSRSNDEGVLAGLQSLERKEEEREADGA